MEGGSNNNSNINIISNLNNISRGNSAKASRVEEEEVVMEVVLVGCSRWFATLVATQGTSHETAPVELEGAVAGHSCDPVYPTHHRGC